jgi:hypothetical protein
MARMKYATVKWLDAAREERPGVWLVSEVRTAKGPAGNVDEQYNCRVSTAGGRTRLELLQIFKEASRTGRDVFYVAR